MLKPAGKGRVSNELVGASCAAILAVYAAGYWRTRDEARRVGSEVPTRPPLRAERAVRPAPAESPAAIAAPATSVATPAVQSALASVPADPESSTATLTTAEPPAQRADSPGVTAAAPASSSELAAATVATPVVAQAASTALASASDAAAAPTPDQQNLTGATALAPAAVGEAATALIWRDGRYVGWGTSAHGDIQAFVTVKGGRIVEAGVQTCETRYPCDVIDTIINQPVVWQSPEVDMVSRATESSAAYYWALVQALKSAEGPAATAASAAAQ